MKVAIQGVKASFHDVAAKKYFKDHSFEVIECHTFTKLFQKLESREADFAVMAIENAIAGSILPNYTLMEKYKVKILGEVLIKIEMCLMCIPGQTLADINAVESHPMALYQCQEFLSKLKDVRVLEHADTAEAAKEIKEKNRVHHAAIASRLAAQTYGLDLLAEGIETDRSNFTRFLVLSRQEDYKRPRAANKSSIRFETEHVPGSLVHVLSIFEKNNVNMTKIQSLPIIGRPYQYAFHADVEFAELKSFEMAMDELKKKTLSLTLFGEYEAGGRPTL